MVAIETKDVSTKIEEINLLNDAIFKAIFRSKETREGVAKFLSRVTKVPELDIQNAHFFGGELIKTNSKEKTKISDVIISLENDILIIVEMNQHKHYNQFLKNASYAMRLFSELTPINTQTYPTIYLINIDNFRGLKTKKGISAFQFLNDEGESEFDNYKSIHIVIENILKDDYNGDEEIKKMITFLTTKNLTELRKKFKGERVYMRMVEKVEQLMEGPEMLGYYDLEEKQKWELESMKITGLLEGKVEGKIDNQREVLKNMLDSGFKKKTILKILNITDQEYKQLQN